jgi:hypothetical protein
MSVESFFQQNFECKPMSPRKLWQQLQEQSHRPPPQPPPPQQYHNDYQQHQHQHQHHHQCQQSDGKTEDRGINNENTGKSLLENMNELVHNKPRTLQAERGTVSFDSKTGTGKPVALFDPKTGRRLQTQTGTVGVGCEGTAF